MLDSLRCDLVLDGWEAVRCLSLAWRPALVLGLGLGLAVGLAQPVVVEAEEGKWLPEQLGELGAERLRASGLELSAKELWDLNAGGGLLEAVVQLNGCSSGFVSTQGLVITNHHCAFGVIQEHSSEERNLIRDGFLAASPEDELPATGGRLAIPVRFTDVTEEVEAAVPDGADDLERHRALERKKKELVAACEAQPFRRCRVATDDNGVRHRLLELAEYPDVRLVYAPPVGIGAYGGEVDNWSWPRHGGDFALLRVYADADNRPAPGPKASDAVNGAEANRPYRPERFLEISTAGVADGDFVMVAGYPGSTQRSWISDEKQGLFERFLPRRAELYRRWIDILEAGDGGIAVAGRVRGLANREKNARGQVDGIRRGDLVGEARRREQQVLRWIEEHPEHAAAAAAYEELQQVQREGNADWPRDFLLSEATRGALPLEQGLELVRWAMQRDREDLDRLSGYQDRDRATFEARLERAQRGLHESSDEFLLADWLAEAVALPDGYRIAAVDSLLASVGIATDTDTVPIGAEALLPLARRLVAGSALLDLETRRTMMGETYEDLVRRGDPLLDFALSLEMDRLASEDRLDRRAGAHARLRPLWRRAVAAGTDGPLDPDANGTLRVSLAKVRGYAPRDAVWMEPLTTVGGVVEKHTGEAPFNAPAALLEAARERVGDPLTDPHLKDVPVCFLATGDTTGGSSGSPVLDARGRLVGLNFDRVWENVANDLGYNPEIARNVSVDIRYLLWVLARVHGEEAAGLLEELGYREVVAKP